jgi:hypothetical protein
MSIAPQQLAFYKGMSGKWGAIQFNFQRAHYFCAQCKAKNFVAELPPKKCTVDGCTSEEFKSREGALFMEITSTKDKNVYDWDKKIVMALSTQEMGKVLILLEGGKPKLTDQQLDDVKAGKLPELTVEIMHDPGAKTSTQGKVKKWLTFSSPKGLMEGVMVRATMKQGPEEAVTHTVPLSQDEVKTLAVFMRHAIPSSLGW